MQGVPPDYREDLAREVYWITLQRARIFSIVALTINLILFYAPDYMIYDAAVRDDVTLVALKMRPDASPIDYYC